MPRRIFKCTKCGRYTLNREKCPYCGAPVVSAHPPRWSPHNRFVEYRVRYKSKLKRLISTDDNKELGDIR